jgi:ZIP family zinc transporter
MASAFFWGLLAASSLVLGGLLASWVPLGKRTLGVILGFGAGVLLSATAYELVFDAVRLAKGSGFPALGFLGGAATFFLADQLIDRFSNGQANTDNAAGQSTLVVPLVLGATLDGIPESVVIGLGLVGGGTVSLAMLVAVFMSNLPEAAAGTVGMRSSGWSRTKVFLLWTAIALVCALASAAGYALLGDLSRFWLSSVQAFAGGAILMMLANSMIPEAYEHGGKLAGVFTVLGFAVSVLVIVFEHGGAG